MGQGIVYQIEQFSNWYQEATGLMQAHWREIYPDNTQFEPQYGFGVALENMGGLLCFTARKESNELIGYSVFVVVPNPRNNEVIAENYMFYLSPKYRQGFAGIHFISYCVNKIEEDYRSPKTIRFYVSDKKDFSSILARIGFHETERVFEKRIKCQPQ